MTRRRYLTSIERYRVMAVQRWRCGCGCGAPVWPGGPVEYDHTLPLALGGLEKPDSALTSWCHTTKTKLDVKRISKADRQRKAHRGEKVRKGRKLEGRGFDKHIRKRMDGTVEARNG